MTHASSSAHRSDAWSAGSMSVLDAGVVPKSANPDSADGRMPMMDTTRCWLMPSVTSCNKLCTPRWMRTIVQCGCRGIVILKSGSGGTGKPASCASRQELGHAEAVKQAFGYHKKQRQKARMDQWSKLITECRQTESRTPKANDNHNVQAPAFRTECTIALVWFVWLSCTST